MINSTTASSQIQFGLCDPPEPIYLYVGQIEANGETALWYQYDIEAEKQLPVLKRGLTGCISELRLTVKEFKGKENSKLNVVVHADKVYIIRSGLETNFSKTLLLALSCITDFKQPLTIAVAPGEENVVFARLYDAATKQRFKAEWNPDANWLDLVCQLQRHLERALSVQDLPLAQQVLPPAPSVTPQALDAHQVPPAAPAEPTPTLSNPERVKAVRTLTGHSADAVKTLLAHYGTDHPKHLSPEQCDLLIETLVTDWYETLHLPKAFSVADWRSSVLEQRQQGLCEADALQALMSLLEHRNFQHSEV